MVFSRDVASSAYEILFSLDYPISAYWCIHRYDRGDLSFIIVSGAMVYLMVPGLGGHSYIFS